METSNLVRKLELLNFSSSGLKDKGLDRESDRSEVRQGIQAGEAESFPWSLESPCSRIRKAGWWAQNRSHRPLRLLIQCRRTKGWLLLANFPPASPSQTPAASLPGRKGERKAIWRLSKRVAFTFREQAGEDCFQVPLGAPPCLARAEGGPGGPGSRPGVLDGLLPLPGMPFPAPSGLPAS